MTAALQALSKFKRSPTRTRSTRFSPCATSATREAENGGDVPRRDRAADRHPRRASSPAPRKRGSSTWPRSTASTSPKPRRRHRHRRRQRRDHAAAPAARSKLARSFKIGVIRLTERFVTTDPLTEPRRAQAGRSSSASRSIATSAHRRGGLRPGDRHLRHDPRPRRGGHGRWIAARRPTKCATCACRPRASQRLRKTVVDAGPRGAAARCPASIRGAPTWWSPARSCSTRILRRLGAEEITLCDLALREGLVLDYIHRHRKADRAGRPLPRRPAPQRRSSWPSAATTGRSTRSRWRALALAIFDQTRGAPRPDATASASGWSTPRCCTTSATTSATSGITATRTT